MDINVGKNISKNLNDECSQKLINMLNNLQQMSLKLLEKEQLKKTVEGTGDLIGNIIANKIAKVSKYWQENDSEAVTYEHDKEIPNDTKIYISRRKRENYWWKDIRYNSSITMEYQKIINLLDNTPNQANKFRTQNGLK